MVQGSEGRKVGSNVRLCAVSHSHIWNQTVDQSKLDKAEAKLKQDRKILKDKEAKPKEWWPVLWWSHLANDPCTLVVTLS